MTTPNPEAIRCKILATDWAEKCCKAMFARIDGFISDDAERKIWRAASEEYVKEIANRILSVDKLLKGRS